MSVSEPVGEIVAALSDHCEGLQAVGDIVSVRRGSEIAGECHDPCRRRRRDHRVQRVQQRGRGDLGGEPVTHRGRQPGFGQAWHRRLRDDQHRHRQDAHEMTFQKSKIATMLPRSEPLTFDLPPVREP